MSEVLLRGGLVFGPDGERVGDVVVSGGVVANVGVDLPADGRTVVECAGAWVGPAFVDLHVHLREPGEEWKEDIRSGREAAAAGGYSAVVSMPNTRPAIDAGHLARQVTRPAPVEVVPAGAITMGRLGERLAHLDELWEAGVRIFSDDGDTVADAGLLRRAMDYLAARGAIIAQHAEDPGLCRGGQMHEGTISSQLGMVGLPAAGEEVLVSRDLRLVEMTGCRYHVQHVSTAGTVELVRRAKEQGLPVTAEATPHHLALDHREVLSLDPVMKMYPPLRTPEDVEALRHGLREGVIDAVATDHAPHADHEKDVPFEEAPRGVIGLETSAAVMNTSVGLTPRAFFERLSIGPGRILGGDRVAWVAPGVAANIVVFDPTETWTPTRFRSRSSNSPWLGRPLTGQVRATVASGEIVHVVDGS
ncbi:MAG: dihydroorotase [Acidimicrobiia bacterium]|jgi:dihydroorotase